MRWVPVKGIDLHKLNRASMVALFLYLCSTAALLWYSFRAMAKYDDKPRPWPLLVTTDTSGNGVLLRNLSIVVGTMAAALAFNAVYWFWIYHH
jgi:hypothetical protein